MPAPPPSTLEVVLEFAILVQKWSKIALQRKVDFWVFANYFAVYSGGRIAERLHCWHHDATQLINFVRDSLAWLKVKPKRSGDNNWLTAKIS